MTANPDQRREPKRKFWVILAVVALMTVGTALTVSWLSHDVSISDGKTRQLTTFKGTVGEVLTEAGIKLGQYDLVQPRLTTEVQDGTRITVTRAFPVKVIADGQTKSLWTTPVQVADVLRKAGVSVGKDDRVEPASSALVGSEWTIRVVRVKFAYENHHQAIPFATETRPDPKMYRGFDRLAQKGQEGLRKTVYKITMEDGKPVKREVVNQEVVQRPISRVIAMGTIRAVSRGGDNIRFNRAIRVSATAYTYTGHRTATGSTPGRGVIAVDPSVIPLGTRVYIEGYGQAVARDVGGAIRGDEVDLFVETAAEARWWGRRTVTLYLLE